MVSSGTLIGLILTELAFTVFAIMNRVWIELVMAVSKIAENTRAAAGLLRKLGEGPEVGVGV